MSGLWLNVAFLKTNQCFIRCDSLWSPSLICEEKDKVSPLMDGLWFFKETFFTLGTIAWVWLDWLSSDRQLTAAWTASNGGPVIWEAIWQLTVLKKNTYKLSDEGGYFILGMCKTLTNSSRSFVAHANTSATVPNTQLLPGQTSVQTTAVLRTHVQVCHCHSPRPSGWHVCVSVRPFSRKQFYVWWLPAPPPYWWSLAQTLGTDSRAHLGSRRGCLNRLLSQHEESQQLSSQTCKSQPQNSPRWENSFGIAAPSVILTIMTYYYYHISTISVVKPCY